ncbi:ferritin-like domain-containing protein [Rhizobium sp. L1K21]|uniref:YciE/YciF ferroxidase family protein n=1 Tax=Rhizobium sp. L1K21 TaxID=2954933 RepID=UPI002093406E|nr:ferritin-like domain-containing protein [Rhizobium sp. L1K21]MCO6187800.1 ferritin-like domain-containing protein [Rhizobium sp. L1K21]
MANKTLDDLFYDTLRDIYYAERRIVKALPKMARGAQDEKLKKAFEKHKEQTEEHIERLQEVFELLDKRPRGKTCQAIDGILDEGEEVLETYKGTPAQDAGILAAAQAVEHYEISRYGTLKTWAERLGHDKIVKILDKTLKEESQTDEALTKLATSQVNANAQDAA